MRRTITLTLLALTLACAHAGARPPASTPTARAAGDDASQRRSEALIEAVKRGELAAVKRLLAAGASPDATDGDGETALSWAIRFNRPYVLQTLIAGGADVNKKEENGDTPLMIAAAVGRPVLVRALLARGAKVNAKDEGGHTPLISATFGVMVRSVPKEVMKFIADPSDAEARESFDAMGVEQLEVAKLLLENGADVNTRADDCGMTALVVASLLADVEMVRTLLAHGADPDKGDKGFTPLRLATMSVEEVGAEMLRGSDLDAQTKQAFLDWLKKTEPARAEIARLLKQAGAKR